MPKTRNLSPNNPRETGCGPAKICGRCILFRIVSSSRPEDGVGVRVLRIVLFARNLLGALDLRKAY